MAYNSISQEFGIFLFQPQSIIFFIPIPLFQLDHHVDRLVIFYTLHTIQCLDINDTNSTQFNKMPGNIRCCSHQRYIADLTDLYHIIRYQTVSTLDQFQGSLTFADTALPHDQHAFAKYIHQYSVNRYTRCQFFIHPANDLRHEIRSGFFCPEYRHSIDIAQIQQFRIRLCLGSKYNTRYLERYKLLINGKFLLHWNSQQIGILHISYDLYTLISEMIKISCQLKCRTINIRNMYFYLRNVDLRSHILQIHLLYHFCQRNTACHLISPYFITYFPFFRSHFCAI